MTFMRTQKERKNAAQQLKKTIRQYKRILISIKGSPDPDAIASAYALKSMCSALGVKATIASPVYPSLPQNIKIIKNLRLPIEFKCQASQTESFDAYAVLDHPSVDIEKLTGAIPCAIHIDHHEPADDNIPVDLKIIWEDVGSVSTIMALLMDQLKDQKIIDSTVDQRIATALYLGMQTDTDDFRHMSEGDRSALDLITPRIDRDKINRINNVSFPEEAIPYLHSAIQNQTIHDDWLISGIGYIDEKLRDTLAIIGDFLLKNEEVSKVVVFALVEKKKGLTLDAVLRTQSKRFNLNNFIQKITTEGGARTYKGAFQVDLDYFRYCPEREQLWKLVYQTTLEALKKQGVPFESNHLRRLASRAKRILSGFLPRSAGGKNKQSKK
jgi:nanoRNase/pAp phosphatase (c-di-AMP/oligoRNAs hydrolase)